MLYRCFDKFVFFPHFKIFLVKSIGFNVEGLIRVFDLGGLFVIGDWDGVDDGDHGLKSFRWFITEFKGRFFSYKGVLMRVHVKFKVIIKI